MFEQTIDQPYRRRGLSKKGWAKMLLFYAVISFASFFLFRHLSNKDAQIAKREVVVAGTVVKSTKERATQRTTHFSSKETGCQGVMTATTST